MSGRRIFYHCYDHQRPNGGQKDTYQHVDVLNDSGYEAYIVHSTPGFRLRWFANSTRIIDVKDFHKLHDPRHDFVVLPEDLAPHTISCCGRKVIFNKNVYTGFSRIDLPADDVDAFFTVSDHNRRQIEVAYPHKMVFKVDFDIRAQVFQYNSIACKKPLVAAGTKEPQLVAALRRIVQARSEALQTDPFEWVCLRDLPEACVADILHDALVFVFLGLWEGLPRMPLEAMACGCLVVAHCCPPLTEYLPSEYGFPVGGLREMGEFIEKVTSSYPDDLRKYERLTQLAKTTAQQYSQERQRQSVVAAWENIFEKYD